jgi:hypothetical protein
MRNKRGAVATDGNKDNNEIMGTTSCKQICDNLDKMDKFPKRHKQPNLTQKQINWKSLHT